MATSEVTVPVVPPVARAMAEAVLAGDPVAALGLADWLRESVPEDDARQPMRLFIYDNGESHDDHGIDYIVAPLGLPPDDVGRLIMSVRSRHNPDGAVVLHALCPFVTEATNVPDIDELWAYVDRRLTHERDGVASKAVLTPALALYLVRQWAANLNPWAPAAAGREMARGPLRGRMLNEGLLVRCPVTGDLKLKEPG